MVRYIHVLEHSRVTLSKRISGILQCDVVHALTEKNLNSDIKKYNCNIREYESIFKNKPGKNGLEAKSMKGMCFPLVQSNECHSSKNE